MQHSIIPFFHNLESLVRDGGYVVVALLSIFEGLPLIGSAIPGHTTIIMSGFFARLGLLSLWPLIAIAASGAVLGDLVGFFLGRHYGYDFLTKLGRYFFLKKEHIDKARAIMSAHTGKAIILGRFSPITRSFIPFLAGASNVGTRQFWVYDVLGGVIWATSSILIGYVFGASYEVVGAYVGKFVFMAIVIGGLIVWGYRFVNSRRHIFNRFEFETLIANLVSLYIFFKMIEDALSSQSFLAALDVQVNLFMDTHQVRGLIDSAHTLTNILSPEVLSVLGALIALYFVARQYWNKLYFTVTTLVGGIVFNMVMKLLIERARPENALIAYSDYAFPSGHAMFATLFFGLVVVTFYRSFSTKIGRDIFIALNILCVVFAGFLRVFLNVHWLTDVIAGVSLGVFWLTLMLLGTRIVSATFAWDSRRKALR